MKKLLLFLCVYISVLFATAQSPTFQWAKSMGGTGYDQGWSITTDELGNVYTTGRFQGTVDFNPGAGVFNLISVGSYDIFISKLDVFGNFVWAKSIGGTLGDIANSIGVDGSGNVYTTGYFNGNVDFDPGVGTFNMTASVGSMFISKLDIAGNFVWAKKIGSTLGNDANSIEIDASDDLYITGSFQGTADFDPDMGAYNLTSAGDYDIFILKLNSNGNFIWAKNMGGTSKEEPFSIIVDASKNVYTTGSFNGNADFDPGVGTFILSPGTVFISKLDAFGDFVWAKKFEGTWILNCSSIGVDSLGNVYLIGSFYDTVDFDPGVGAYNITSNGGSDIFISKLDINGDFCWVRRAGSSDYDQGFSLAVDLSGNVYTTGEYDGTISFVTSSGWITLSSISATTDIFISKLDTFGNCVWANSLGGTSMEFGHSIAIDTSGNVYTTGYFKATADFNPGSGTFNLVSAGGEDVFVHKMSQPFVGIEENTKTDNIAIFPNPNNGVFNIFTSQQIINGNIEIYNTIGELIFSQKIINQQNTIDLKNQASGLYFVKVISDGGVVAMKKVVKE